MLDKKESILFKALELFNRDGFQQTGIDKIILETPVAKMTFYKHFKSKDYLVCCVLDKVDEILLQSYRKIFESENRELGPILREFFQLIELTVNKGSGVGCLYQRAALEYINGPEMIREQIIKHKTSVRTLFEKILEMAIDREKYPNISAALLFALYESAFIQSATYRRRDLISQVPSYLFGGGITF